MSGAVADDGVVDGVEVISVAADSPLPPVLALAAIAGVSGVLWCIIGMLVLG